VSGVAFTAAFLGGFATAWLWWSLMLPKWRLWTYARVANPLAIKHKAVEAQLAWRDGSFFSRTEIKSGAHAAREAEWESRALAAHGRYQPPPRVEETIEDQVKAFFLLILPALLGLAALTAHDRLAGEGLSSKHNTALLIFGLMTMGAPYAYRRLGAEFAGWLRYFPAAALFTGASCLILVDYSSLGTAVRVAALPLLIALGARAWVSYVSKR
jgi:hypothetical protein